MGLKKTQQKEYAEILFTRHNLNYKQIEDKVGVTAKTIGKWADDENWNDRKKSLTVTKEQQIKSLYQQLDDIRTGIEKRSIIRDIPVSLLKPIKVKDADGGESLQYADYDPEDFPIKQGNTPNSQEAHIIQSLTNSINKLELETGVGETIEIMIKFIDFINSNDVEFAKQVSHWSDLFIQSRM
ncbi:hypothetical protein HX096_12715 [Empedobacter falsenii]|uniref:hypothetical protein n=1 Tax=Empedobacter falsenii TaxID=343874 RepID=UPI002576005E|nr:hypothetical protein [Empedobacter falsenii]MDM1548715.1 hypothetical protein [Empedobacter falsenii]